MNPSWPANYLLEAQDYRSSYVLLFWGLLAPCHGDHEEKHTEALEVNWALTTFRSNRLPDTQPSHTLYIFLVV